VSGHPERPPPAPPRADGATARRTDVPVSVRTVWPWRVYAPARTFVELGAVLPTPARVRDDLGIDGDLVDDRGLLLDAKRDAVLDLWEVQRYGTDSFDDPDYTCVYGLRPVEWYANGVRLLGRTVVECTLDVLADAIDADTAAAVRGCHRGPEWC
jgi:hypothetical protein